MYNDVLETLDHNNILETKTTEGTYSIQLNGNLTRALDTLLIKEAEKTKGVLDVSLQVILDNATFRRLDHKKKFLLAVPEHKIMKMAMSRLTCTNIGVYSVCIPLLEFMEKTTGYIPSMSLEDEDTEISKLKNFCRKLRNNLRALRRLEASFTSEKIKGKAYSFKELNIITGVEVTQKGIGGYIKIDFHPEIADYLRDNHVIYFNEAIYRLDPNDVSSYSMAELLNNNYYSVQNRNKASSPYKYRTLKVKTLLEVTNLPTKEEANKGKGWNKRIKEEFEKKLDILVKENVLTEWRYAGKHGAELEGNTYLGGDYDKWINTNVFYEMSNHEEFDKYFLERSNKLLESAKKKRKKKE